MKKTIQSAFLISIFLSQSAYSLTIGGENELDITGSEFAVYAYDSSTVTVLPWANVSWLYGYDDSTINVSDGTSVSWLYGYGNSNLNVDGGDISWLHVYDNSQTDISFLYDLSWLVVNDNAVVNIYGSDFSYENGHLSGRWNNGYSFRFWALEEADLSSGNIRSLLPDNIVLHMASVPEPSPSAVFGAGILLLAASRRGGRIAFKRSSM